MEERVLELKREALKHELEKPKHFQDKFKIRRLQESIKRHKKIAKIKVNSIRFERRKRKIKCLKD